MGFKNFSAGDALTEADLDDYLMAQANIVCTSATRPSSPVEGMKIVETDTDLTLIYTGSAWRGTGYYGANPLFARKTSNQAITSSASLTNDTALLIPNLVANAVYRVELSVQYFSAASGTTPGLQVDFTLPAAADVGFMSYELTGQLGRALTNGAVTGITATTSISFLKMDGLLVMSATAGPLQFRWAQNVSSGSHTTVASGSYLLLTRQS